ncbi:hypothetical protein Tco_0596274 [Tanacetum coccineum]
MTNDNPPPTPALTLSDKLMAMNHLTTFVPEKLDVDAMNYSSFLDILHPCSITKETLVDLNPTTAKDAWTYIGYFKTTTPAMQWLWKATYATEAWEFSITYFQKIESIVSFLNGLGSPLSNDDVVTFALEGLPSTYKTISTVIVSREPFPDHKTVRSLLTTHEMRLKSRVQNPLVDATSVSPMVLLAKFNTIFHNGVHGKSTLLPRTSGSASSVSGVTRSDLDMLQSLLAKFVLNAPNIFTPSPPVAYTVYVPPGFQSVLAQLSAQPTYVSPQLLPGSFGVSNMGMARLFPQGVQYPTRSPQQGVHYPHQGVQTLSGPPQGVHLVPGTSQPPVQFTTGVQQQQGGSFPGSVHLGQSPSMPFHPSQLDILNMCIYPSVAVGDGRFIPVTNSGHRVLSTPFRPLRLNNVLITPNIVKNLISVRQFVRDNSCTVEFDLFGFSVKDFITRRVLLRCDSTGELYPLSRLMIACFGVSDSTLRDDGIHPPDK